jgi:hypothetical protein
MLCIIWEVLFFGQEDGHSYSLIMVMSSLVSNSPVKSLFCKLLKEVSGLKEPGSNICLFSQFLCLEQYWKHLELNREKLLIVVYRAPF